jgi:hypothetical protein
MRFYFRRVCVNLTKKDDIERASSTRNEERGWDLAAGVTVVCAIVIALVAVCGGMKRRHTERTAFGASRVN